jgi:hypothetical protein
MRESIRRSSLTTSARFGFDVDVAGGIEAALLLLAKHRKRG